MATSVGFQTPMRKLKLATTSGISRISVATGLSPRFIHARHKCCGYKLERLDIKMPVIRERKHRFPKESYRGEISVAFTLCLKRDSISSEFLDPKIVDRLIDILTSVVSQAGCFIPVYCFMPDHQHLIVSGRQKDSDIWNTMVKYKQKTGFWLSNNTPLRWQKDFYDHAIRSGEDVAAQVRYILDNPVRKGLAKSCEEYPYKGSIGCRLEDVLSGIL